MKLKKLHIAGSLLIAGIAISTLQSNSAGITGRSTVGCGGGGCHNNSASTATTVTVTGLPAGGWMPNTAYTLTIKVANSTAAKAGFDLTVNVGTLASVTSGTMAMGTELHHTTPQTMASGAASWTFTWTSPTSRSTGLTMAFAGNAVNGNGGADNSDLWNNSSITLAAAANTSIANTVSGDAFFASPNPAKDVLMLNTAAAGPVEAGAVSIDGRFVALTAQKTNTGTYQLAVGQLPAGMYTLVVKTAVKRFTTKFVKQ